jgi:hypothetical protein
LCNFPHSPVTSSLFGPNIPTPQNPALRHPQSMLFP